MIEPSDQPLASSRQRERGVRDDDLSETPTLDSDMTAQVMLERAVFPASGAAPSTSPPPEAALDRSPVSRAGLASGLMLAIRFVQARFVSVWGLLVAAALCPAEAFAQFALFAALANFISIGALFRFEAVFFQSSDWNRLGRAFRLASGVGFSFMAVVAAGLAVASIGGWLDPAYAVLFLVSLTGRAVMRLVCSEATAEGDFKAIGNSNIVQALVQPVVMLLLIWLIGPDALSLFAADAIGHVVAASYLIWRRRASLANLLARDAWSVAELSASAARWRAVPRYLLPSALLSFGFMVVPLATLLQSGNPLLAAHLALAMRLLEMPTQMFAAVSVPLVMSSLRSQGTAHRQGWVRCTTLWLMAGSAALFAGIAIVAVIADVVLDGSQWEGVGEVVAIMAVFYGGIALVTPLHEMSTLSRHPRRQAATNAVALLGAVLVMLWFGPLSLAMLSAIGAVSLARMLAHVQFVWTRLG